MGKRARELSNRRSVVNGVRACLRRGEGQPSAERIAEVTDVPLRSAARHLRDYDSILADVVELETERFAAAEHSLAADAPFERRIDELVTLRLRRHQRLRPARMASEISGVRIDRAAVLQRDDAIRSSDRTRVATLFAAELSVVPAERRERLAAASAALSPALWRELRSASGLSAKRAHATVACLLRSALRPAARAAAAHSS